MITEDEKRWMERRKKNEKEYGSVCCPYCEQFNPEWDLYLGYCNDKTDCQLTEHDFSDAAEFEARVAEKLARNICYNCSDEPESCPSAFEYPRKTGERCRLMHARIAVEQEMDELNDA